MTPDIDISSNWMQSVAPTRDGRGRFRITERPTKTKAIANLLNAFLASGDECWAKVYPADRRSNTRDWSRSAESDAVMISAVARANGSQCRIARRGCTVYLVREADDEND